VTPGQNRHTEVAASRPKRTTFHERIRIVERVQGLRDDPPTIATSASSRRQVRDPLASPLRWCSVIVAAHTQQ
jgi:hypothetical protein